MNDENLKSWKPGQSGNPKGKPKGTQSARTIIEKYINALSPSKHPDTLKNLTYHDAAWMQQISKAALKGDLSALNAITDRLEGQAKQSLEISDMSQEDVQARLKELLGDKYNPGE